MKQANLRKVGGSTMIAIPTAYLAELNIKAGDSISIRMENGKLICSKSSPDYSLEELLACTPEDISQDIKNEGWIG